MMQIKPGDAAPQEPTRLVGWVPAGGWRLLIFVTSCYYVGAGPFVAFIDRVSPAPVRRVFPQFWEACGLYVVKGWHVTEYAVLYFLTGRVAQRWSKGRLRASLTAAVVCVAFAMSDEWHQTFVPGREGCVRDVAIDSCGVALAVVISRPWRGRCAVTAP